ncbi:MAG: HD domain-containing protein [Planctomycetota bacterium]
MTADTPLGPLDALLALLPLHDLPRTGWLQHGIQNPESVGDHTLGTCLVALALAQRAKPSVDVDRAVALALVHDAPEALIGDWPKPASRLLPPGAKAAVEDKAAAQLLGPLSNVAHERFVEYRQMESREARFVRVCDGLHLGLRLLAYRRRGHGDLADFEKSLAELDCSEFDAADELKRDLIAALHALARAH